MADKTQNYGLSKPLAEEFYDVNVQNGNMDIIDAELKKRASLDETGKVPSSQLPEMDYIPKNEKGALGGVAPLDGSGKVPSEYFPETVGGGKRTNRIVIGTSTSGWTTKDCDYLCGGTSDEEEINQAVAMLPTGGGEIVLLDGTYNLSSAAIVNKNNVTIRGNGTNTKLVRAFTGSHDYDSMMILSGMNSVVRDIWIDGAKGTYSGEYQHYGISLRATNITIENCTITDCGSDAIYGNGNYAPHYAIIRGNRITGCYSGISLLLCDHYSITDNVLMNNGYYGISIGSSKYNTVSGNVARLNGKRNISIYNSHYNVVSNNDCSVESGDTVVPAYAAIQIQDIDSTNNIVSNNIVGTGSTINNGGDGNVITTIHNITAGTQDLEAGVSELRSGDIYFVYE